MAGAISLGSRNKAMPLAQVEEAAKQTAHAPPKMLEPSTGDASSTRRFPPPPSALTRPYKTLPLSPDEVRETVTQALPVAVKSINQAFGQYTKPAPKPALEFLTADQMKARGFNDGVAAYVREPSTIHVNTEPARLQRFPGPRDREGLLQTVTHELLHTRSDEFSKRIARDYGRRPFTGEAPTFPDGTSVELAVVEGLTERFALEALNTNYTPSAYGPQRMWANKLIEAVGADVVKRAYFSNDSQAVRKLESAIDFLVAGPDPEKQTEILRKRDNVYPMGY